MIDLSDKISGNSTRLTKDQFDDFFKENYHAACLVAWRYIPEISSVEDLVQDAFVIPNTLLKLRWG